MSYARTSIKGIVFSNSYQAFNGFTLFTPYDGTRVWLIDMKGEMVNYWDMGVKAAGYTELLPNGSLLFTGKHPDSPLPDVEGAGGILLEVDWDGNIIWNYENPCLHDSFFRKDNGNTLVIKWVKIPKNIADKVKGGIPGTEREDTMWGDTIQEITQKGLIQWSWTAHEHLDPELDISCPICPRIEWTHANGCLELPDGDILVTFWKNNEIIVLNKNSGDVTWRWGYGQLAHPYNPTLLDNGNILVFDSGYHQQGADKANSRVLEIVPYTGDIIWSYEHEEDNHLFYSSTISNCQRLPNGNNLVCEGSTGRIFEITSNGELVWEYINNLPLNSTFLPDSKHCKVFAAKRYGVDYSGLKRGPKTIVKKQAAPGMYSEKDSKIASNIKEENQKGTKEAVLSRLRRLGY